MKRDQFPSGGGSSGCGTARKSKYYKYSLPLAERSPSFKRVVQFLRGVPVPGASDPSPPPEFSPVPRPVFSPPTDDMKRRMKAILATGKPTYDRSSYSTAHWSGKPVGDKPSPAEKTFYWGPLLGDVYEYGSNLRMPPDSVRDVAGEIRRDPGGFYQISSIFRGGAAAAGGFGDHRQVRDVLGNPYDMLNNMGPTSTPVLYDTFIPTAASSFRHPPTPSSSS